MKVLQSIKSFFNKVRFESIAVTAVLVSQALKRMVQSDFVLLVAEMAPLPWVNLLSKIFQYIKKANEVVPLVAKNIIVTKGILDKIDDADDKKLALRILADHLKFYKKDQLNEFLKYFSMEVMDALAGDNKITAEEKDKLVENVYTKLFKNGQA